MPPATEKVPRVSIVIPNWNGAKLLPIVLDSLREQTYRDFEIVVVDNGSTDESLTVLREYGEVRVVALPENRGFSAAVNAGIRHGSGEFVALVNNDVEFDPEWLGALVSALDEDPRAGFAASRLRMYDARGTLDSAGDQVQGVPKARGHGLLDGPEFDKPAYVTSACAAAALYRRGMLDDIGLFNESLFAYFEDVELGMRAQIAGYRCLYVPTAIGYHMGSTTSKRISKRTAYYQLRNLVQVFLTTLPPRYMLGSIPRLCRAWVWLAVYKGGLIVAARALLSILFRVPRIIVERSRHFSKRRVSNGELESTLEPPSPLTLALIQKHLSGTFALRSRTSP